ncbi:MAG: tandem-95 repeat protein [Candidatus Thermoplasmatota archaeon]|nr:tandem-95 repeat protein [Candidatus Thermoplasmatota archaeon]
MKGATISAPMMALLMLSAALIIVPSNDSSRHVLSMEPLDDVELPPYGYYKGTLPVPFDNESFEGAYANASEHSQFVPVWGRPTPFYDMASELNGAWGDTFVDELIRGNGMFPLINMNFYGAGLALVEPPGLSGSTLATPEWRKAYHDSAMDILNASRPMYMSLGNEVNRWFEVHGAEEGDDSSFLYYVSLYEAIYDDIKALSPATKVYCTFSREIVAENREADLSVLTLFNSSKLDLLVLTSYPFSLAGVDEVSDLPDDYYSKAFDHIDCMPIGFSELGWPTDGPFGGEEGQAAFIRNMTSRLTLEEGLDIELLGWAWLTDLTPTDSIGLMDRGGNKKEGFAAWVNNRAPLYDRSNRTIVLKEDFGEYVYELSRTYYDPDPWEDLEYTIWNGTSYTDRSNGTLLSAIIKGGTLVLTSGRNMSGTKQLRVMARDWGGLTVWTMLQVTVEQVNDPPALDPAFEKLLLLGEDDYRFFDMKEYLHDDLDELEEITISVLSAPFLVVTIDLSVSPYMTIYTEVPDWWGQTYIRFTVIDRGGLSIECNLTVEVLPLNDPPIINCPPYLEIEEDTPVSRDIMNWVMDADPGDPLYKEALASDPKNVSILFVGTVMTLRPAQDWHGTMVIELAVSDGSELDKSSFELHVQSVNDPPVALAPPDAVVLEDHVHYLDLGSLEPFDPDNDRLFWSVVNLTYPVGSAVFLPNSTLRVAPMNDAFGTANLTLVMEDGAGGRTELELRLRVLPVNDPPLFIVPSPWTVVVKRGVPAEIDLMGTDFTVEDPDDPVGSLHIEADSGLIASKDLSLKVTVPIDLPNDRFSVRVLIRDPHGATSETRELIVSVNNGTPQDADRIRVTDVDIDRSDDGRVVTIHAVGDPNQTIWVVLKGGSGSKVSSLMEEFPLGSGHYKISMKDLPFKDGELVTYHLSLTEGGPNDSLVPASTFTYDVSAKEGGLEGTAILFIAIIAISLTALILLGAYLFMKRNEDVLVEGSGPFEE